MLEGYLNGLEENEIRFISENHENFRVIVDEEYFLRLQNEIMDRLQLTGQIF